MRLLTLGSALGISAKCMAQGLGSRLLGEEFQVSSLELNPKV